MRPFREVGIFVRNARIQKGDVHELGHVVSRATRTLSVGAMDIDPLTMRTPVEKT